MTEQEFLDAAIAERNVVAEEAVRLANESMAMADHLRRLNHVVDLHRYRLRRHELNILMTIAEEALDEREQEPCSVTQM